MTEESSSRPRPASRPARYNRCAAAASGAWKPLVCAASVTSPMSLTKMSSALRTSSNVPLDHPLAAVVEHERRGRAVAHHLPARPRVEAHRLREGERLGGDGDVHATEQLVDELDLLPVARLRSDDRGGAGHRVEQGPDASPGSSAPADHDQQIAVGRPRDAARDRRVDEVDPLGREPVRPALDGIGPDRRHHEHDRARRERRARRLVANSTASTCSGVATISARTSASRRRLRDRGGGLDPVAGQRRGPGRVEVEGADVVSRARETHAAIGPPIAPSPIQPTRAISSSFVVFGRPGGSASPRRPRPSPRPPRPGAAGCRRPVAEPARARRRTPAAAPR